MLLFRALLYVLLVQWAYGDHNHWSEHTGGFLTRRYRAIAKHQNRQLLQHGDHDGQEKKGAEPLRKLQDDEEEEKPKYPFPWGLMLVVLGVWALVLGLMIKFTTCGKKIMGVPIHPEWQDDVAVEIRSSAQGSKGSQKGSLASDKTSVRPDL